jgi:hypothetical protein
VSVTKSVVMPLSAPRSPSMEREATFPDTVRVCGETGAFRERKSLLLPTGLPPALSLPTLVPIV